MNLLSSLLHTYLMYRINKKNNENFLFKNYFLKKHQENLKINGLLLTIYIFCYKFMIKDIN